jgi:hypothetical protein
MVSATMCWRFLHSARGLLLLVLSVYLAASPAAADELELRWSNDEIRWAQPVTLEVTARNPTGLTVEGGITISFSSQVLVLDQSPGSRVYFPGSELMRAGHDRTIRSRDVMVETWYSRWPPRAQAKAWVTFFPVRSGLLTVKTRAAWIRSIVRRSVTNAPRYSDCTDQQGYPTICRYVRVHESPATLEALREAVGGRLAWDSRTFSYLQLLLLRPTDERALAYFGIELDANARRYLEQYVPVLRSKLREPRLRDHPKLLHYLLRVVRNPLDSEALIFLGFEDKSPPEPEDPRQAQINEVKNYLSDLQGGTNLLSLIAAEGDVSFGYSRDPRTIVLEHGGRRYSFRRGSDVVVRMIEGLMKIKPGSKYIYQKEEVSGYSYREVLKILRVGNARKLTHPNVWKLTHPSRG